MTFCAALLNVAHTLLPPDLTTLSSILVGLGLGLVPVHGPGREAAVTPGPGATAEIAELAPVRLRTLRREVDLSRQ